MTITTAELKSTLRDLCELLPFQARLSDGALALAWSTLPLAVIEQLDAEHLHYAAGQLLLDPHRPKDMPLHLQLLRYLYRLENDQPNLIWGLRSDLRQRMGRKGFQALPISEAERDGSTGAPNHDGPRHDEGGVLAGLNLFASLSPVEAQEPGGNGNGNSHHALGGCQR